MPVRPNLAQRLGRWLPGSLPRFRRLEIETCSSCNRTCASCLRNSYPDRSKVADWFTPNFMDQALVEKILRDAHAMDFRGSVCLQHYNEPLMDDRIAGFGRFALALGGFHEVFISTNADYITAERAADLDGAFTHLVIALYMDEPQKTEREQWLRSMFTRTKLRFTGGGHIPTHFSPDFDVAALAQAQVDDPCALPLRRLILNHRGDMLLCCEDLVGHFGLGNVRTQSVRELWHSERHRAIVKDLLVPGGRRGYAYCESCPRSQVKTEEHSVGPRVRPSRIARAIVKS
jgi:MoaA/NifB/PqqE/SkfB family radical SAM enzyme